MGKLPMWNSSGYINLWSVVSGQWLVVSCDTCWSLDFGLGLWTLDFEVNVIPAPKPQDPRSKTKDQTKDQQVSQLTTDYGPLTLSCLQKSDRKRARWRRGKYSHLQR